MIVFGEPHFYVQIKKRWVEDEDSYILTLFHMNIQIKETFKSFSHNKSDEYVITELYKTAMYMREKHLRESGMFSRQTLSIL